MIDTIFEHIDAISTEDNFGLFFKLLNIDEGWDIMQTVTEDETIRKALVKYVAYAYSSESKMMRNNKDRLTTKKEIAAFVGLLPPNEEYIYNQNTRFNKYISWWLKESQDRKFGAVLSGFDLAAELFETSREGAKFEILFGEEDFSKTIRDAIKNAAQHYKLKAENYTRAVKIMELCEKQLTELKKEYEYLYNIATSDNKAIIQDLPPSAIFARNKKL